MKKTRVVIDFENENLAHEMGRRLRTLGYAPATLVSWQETHLLPFCSHVEVNDVVLLLLWNDSNQEVGEFFGATILVVPDPQPTGGYRQKIVGAICVSCSDRELEDAIKAAMRLNEEMALAHLASAC